MTGGTMGRLIRSKRRSVSLEVGPDAGLVIRAPRRMPFYLIERFVSEKQPWIEEKQRLALVRRPSPKQFVNGERFLYLGEAYPLRIVEDTAAALTFERDPGEFRLLRSHLFYARQSFIIWYKREAHRLIGESLARYAPLAGSTFASFSITDARKRWGSCTARDNLHFSWRLAMTPREVIDYVVVHELAHIEERNHGKGFWNNVSALFPAYRACKAWLNANSHLLTL